MSELDNKEDDHDDGNVDLDLETFGKKKKKKKKPFNMEELEGALLTDTREEQIVETTGALDDTIVDDSFDLDMDFSKTKKKKKKKKDLDELMAETDDKQEDKENGKYQLKTLLRKVNFVIYQFKLLYMLH